MAQYKLSRGPRYGEVIHLPQSQEVALALALGDIELVPDAPAPAKQPQWGIAPSAQGADVCIVYTLATGEQQRYAGPANKARDGFKRRVWSGEAQNYVFDGPEPPEEVLAAYTAQKGQHERQAQAMMAAKERSEHAQADADFGIRK